MNILKVTMYRLTRKINWEIDAVFDALAFDLIGTVFYFLCFCIIYFNNFTVTWNFIMILSGF